MKYIINENQIGYLTRNGVFRKVLEPGRYSYLPAMGYDVKVVSAKGEVDTCGIPAKKLQQDAFFAANTVEKTVPSGSFAFIIADGIPVRCVTAGTALWWKLFEDVEIRMVTPESPEISADFPRELLNAANISVVSRLAVPVGAVSMLYYDNTFVRELPTGVYWFWKNGVEVTHRQV
ncbi:MAG: hypothetical protein E7554_09555, partial [Ruminococcaceae bacterium]|nr:hypothetical protein [Oscillospiraceae bacterium]